MAGFGGAPPYRGYGATASDALSSGASELSSWLGQNGGTAAGVAGAGVDIGVSAVAAYHAAKRQAQKDKEEAMLRGWQAMANAADDKGNRDIDVFGRMMNIGRR